MRICKLQNAKVQGPPNGGVSNGVVSRSGLVLPFLSFFVLFGTFPIFPGFSRFARGWSGDFPDSFLFCLETPRFSFSQILCILSPQLTTSLLNEREITHLIGAQPVLESYAVSDGFWALPLEIAEGMSQTICNYCSTRKEKERKKSRKARTTLEKSCRTIFRRARIRRLIWPPSICVNSASRIPPCENSACAQQQELAVWSFGFFAYSMVMSAGYLADCLYGRIRKWHIDSNRPPPRSTPFRTLTSGKDKAHKHKLIFPVTARVGGGSPDRVARGLPTGGQGSKVYVLCAEPKEHNKHLRPGTRPGGSVTGVTEKLFMCQMFMCLFRPLSLRHGWYIFPHVPYSGSTTHLTLFGAVVRGADLSASLPSLALLSPPECTKIARFSAVAAAIFTAPGNIARLFEAPRCAISSAKKIASEPRLFLRWKRVKMILVAEFPAIPSSAVKNKSLANGDARFWCTQLSSLFIQERFSWEIAHPLHWYCNQALTQTTLWTETWLCRRMWTKQLVNCFWIVPSGKLVSTVLFLMAGSLTWVPIYASRTIIVIKQTLL